MDSWKKYDGNHKQAPGDANYITNYIIIEDLRIRKNEWS